MTNAGTALIEHLGQPAVELALADGSRAVVLLHGAHVVSWRSAAGEERLYLSPQAVAREGSAVRGGVPVVFPQFEQLGPDVSLPRHGLVRTRAWTVDSHAVAGDGALAVLTLSDDAATRALWPHAFCLELTVSLAPQRLDLELHVVHAGQTGDAPWAFSAALHTYLAVSDLSQVRLQGLEGSLFTDRVTDGQHVEDHLEKRFSGEIDRIYQQVAGSLLLRDGASRLSIVSDAFEDVVLWNPGPDKCTALSDMPDADWRHMLCVEAAQITNPPTLSPGDTWTGRQSLVLEG